MKSIHEQLRDHGVKSINAHAIDGRWELALILTREAADLIGLENTVLQAHTTEPHETPEDLAHHLLPYVTGEKELPAEWAPRRELAKVTRSLEILTTCMRELLGHIEREASNGDGIPDFMWQCYHAARMYAGKAHRDWDSAAAQAWHEEHAS